MCGPQPRPQKVLPACLHPLMLQLLLLGAWRRCLSRADWARCRKWTKCLQGVGQRVTRMPRTAIFTAGGKVLQPWVDMRQQGRTVCIWCQVHDCNACPELPALAAVVAHCAQSARNTGCHA